MQVLVADDDSTARLILTRLLQGWGHDVVTALDGTEARLKYESNPGIQVLVLDWVMPGMDGLEICRWVRSQQLEHYVFIILVTSRSGKGDFLEGMAAGADDFLPKPVDPDELQVRLHVAERIIGLKTEVQVQEGLNRGLRELDEMKSAFIRLVSHELRTPLAILGGNLELLRRQLQPQQEKALGLLGALTQSSERLTNIVLRTLQLVSGEEYNQPMQFESVTPQELIAQVACAASVFANLRNQTIRMETAKGLSPIRLDPNLMHDALLNLVMNAIKFSPDGGEIRITAAKTGAGALRFQVEDQGIGISEEDKPHIFEKYFSTLDMSHHSTGDYGYGKRGIGLGLPITKYFAEVHGGSVGFESRQGEGSCFWISLPMEDQVLMRPAFGSLDAVRDPGDRNSRATVKTGPGSDDGPAAH